MRWWRTWWTLTFCSWARIPPLNILSTRQWPLPRVTNSFRIPFVSYLVWIWIFVPCIIFSFTRAVKIFQCNVLRSIVFSLFNLCMFWLNSCILFLIAFTIYFTPTFVSELHYIWLSLQLLMNNLIPVVILCIFRPKIRPFVEHICYTD